MQEFNLKRKHEEQSEIEEADPEEYRNKRQRQGDTYPPEDEKGRITNNIRSRKSPRPKRKTGKKAPHKQTENRGSDGCLKTASRPQ